MTAATSRPSAARPDFALIVRSIGLAAAVAAWPLGSASAQDAASKPKASKPAKTTSPADNASTAKSGQTIVALVNDEPVSAYDVEQRINLLLLTSPAINDRMKARLQDPGINEKFKQFAMARNPRSQEEVKALQAQFVAQIRQQAVAEARPTQRKAALEEIIEERIKIQAAKKGNITVSEADVTAAVMELAKRNNKSEKEFAAMLAGMGVNINTMKDRFRAGIAWRDVVRRQFGHQISIGQQDIEKAVASAAGGAGTGTLTDMALVKVLLPLPAKNDEKTRTARFAEAEALRQKITACKMVPGLLQTTPGVKFEDLGTKEASAFTEPTRSLLINAKVGETTPPSFGAGAVEMYVMCAKQQRTVAESKREEAARELQSQEFDLLARKHLKSLRQDAVIDYR